MFFVYKEARLEWREGKGYRLPDGGEWVKTQRECLRGWIEPDPEKRGQWAKLVNLIDDFWPRLETNKLELGQEVIFE
jgi:hypothetical protein